MMIHIHLDALDVTSRLHDPRCEACNVVTFKRRHRCEYCRRLLCSPCLREHSAFGRCAVRAAIQRLKHPYAITGRAA